VKEFIYLQKNNKILLATSNKGKINEFNKIFSNFHLIPQDAFGISEPIEDGLTFFENALIKARNAVKESGIFTIADDSGIVVPALDFEPGIYSARYAGMNASDLDNRNKIILGLKERNLTSSPAYYVCVLVGLNNEDDPMPIVTSGEIHGEVSIESSGDGGFGYDKIFYPSGYKFSMATMDPKEKNRISHRAIAAKIFLKQLENRRSS
jgi:XTP/dITP diphosphohydrolase